MFQISLGFEFSIACNIAALGVIVYLVIKGSRQPPRFHASACPKCGHDARITSDGKCPECGEKIAPPSYDQRRITQCDFCGKSNRQTGPQMMGPNGAYICATCVELGYRVIQKNREKLSKEEDISN